MKPAIYVAMWIKIDLIIRSDFNIIGQIDNIYSHTTNEICVCRSCLQRYELKEELSSYKRSDEKLFNRLFQVIRRARQLITEPKME